MNRDSNTRAGLKFIKRPRFKDLPKGFDRNKLARCYFGMKLYVVRIFEYDDHDAAYIGLINDVLLRGLFEECAFGISGG